MDGQPLHPLPVRQFSAGSGRRLQYGYNTDSARRPRRRKRKILKLMTQEQIDNKFPIMPFKAAREASPLNRSSDDAETKESTVTMVQSMSCSESLPDVQNDTDLKHEYDDDEKPLRIKDLSDDDKPSKRRSFLRPFSMCSRHSQQRASTPNNQDTADHTVFNNSPDIEAGALLPPSSLAPQHDVDTDDDDEECGPIPACEGSLNTCAICIDDMTETTPVRGLTCGHLFHPECIDPWLLTRQARCPLCKTSFYAPKPEDPLGPDPVEVIEQQERDREREVARVNGPMRRLSRRLWGSRLQSEAERRPPTASTDSEVQGVPSVLPSVPPPSYQPSSR